MTTAILEERVDPNAHVNEDWMKIMGKEYFPRPNPVYYRHIESGVDYAYLAGAVGWPVFGGQGGCLLVIGITREEKPSFVLLSEYHSKSASELIREAIKFRTQYTYGFNSKLLKIWTGDPTRFEAIIQEENIKSRGSELSDRHMFLISSPADFESPNRDELYIEQIQRLSLEKRLKIAPSFFKTRDAITGMTAAEVIGALDQYPVVFALGSLLHDLLAHKAWLIKNRVYSYDL